MLKRNMYESTICFLTNYTIIEYKCPTEECHPGRFNQQNTTVDSTCYLQIYFVTYHVLDGRKLKSTLITTDKHPGPYEVSITF